MLRFYSLALIMTTIAIIIGGVSVIVLYNTAYEEKRLDLIQLAKSQARLIESIARFSRKPGDDVFPEESTTNTISQVKDAISVYKGFGQTGEFVLGKKVANEIVFLLQHRHRQLDSNGQPTNELPKAIPFSSKLAQPMRLALSNQSGTIVGLDYRGEKVLAAHEPIKELNLGIVAKIDISEIRAPYYKEIGLISGIAIVIITGGIFLFFKISNPILKRIQDNEARTSGILNNVVDGIITIDSIGTIETLNPAAARIFNYEVEELIGQNVKILMPEPYHSEHDGYLKKYQQTGEAKIIGVGRDLIGRRKDGSTFPLRLAINELYISQQRMFTGILRDITLQKRNEEEMLAAKEDAEKASRAKSVFLSNMSHELRTPLNAILGFSQLLDVTETDEVKRNYIQEIIAGGNHLLELINEILDLATIETGKQTLSIKNHCLQQIISDSLSMVKPFADSHSIQIEDRVTSLPDISVYIDAMRFKQVLLNILSNAIKYNNENGKVTIDCLSNDNNMLDLSITDTGSGFTPDQLSHLFEPFERFGAVNSRIEGTGLGLVIAKNIIENMGGAISVESEVGKGSRFIIQVPLT